MRKSKDNSSSLTLNKDPISSVFKKPRKLVG
jgi:hypothetical protein